MIQISQLDFILAVYIKKKLNGEKKKKKKNQAVHFLDLCGILKDLNVDKFNLVDDY